MAAVKKTPVAKTKVTPTVEKEEVNLNEELELLRQEIQALKDSRGDTVPDNMDKITEDYAMKVKKYCDEAEKVELTIPFNESNPADDIFEVNISGYKWQIRRGEPTMVPKPIADVYNESYRDTIRATNRIKFDAKKPILSL